MDIRMFFKKKDGPPKKEKKTTKKASSASEEAANSGVSETAKPKEAPSRNKQRKKLVIESSSEEETPKKTVPKKRKAEKSKVPVSASRFFDETSSTSTKKQRSVEKTIDLTKEQAVPKSTTATTPKVKRTAADDANDANSSSKKPRRSSKKSPPKQPPKLSLKPTRSLDSFNIDDPAYSGCLEGQTFCFSGNMEHWPREDATDFVKILGGRVTTAVSGKTNYLVVGDILEDGRPYTEGSKYRKAMDLGTVMIVRGQKALYGLAQQYHEDRGGGKIQDMPKDTHVSTSSAIATGSAANPASAEPLTASPPAKKVAANPYAKKAGGALSNPYARSAPKANPYAKPSSNPYAKKADLASAGKQGDSKPAAVEASHANANDTAKMLWVDKYKPSNSREILGNQDAVRKLQGWLRTWEDKFNHPKAGKSFSGPNGPWKAALLSGPPGIGKTTTATLVAKESGRDVLEFNASDVRSKKSLQQGIGDVSGSRTIEFNEVNAKTRRKRCIIMDEVDGMGAGDRSGMSELIQMIKNSRVPIICICNDRQNQKMKSLVPYCMDLRYRRPVKSTIAKRAMDVARREGLSVEMNAAEAIAESCGNDVRQVLNSLQMWASKNKSTSNDKQTSLTYKDLKSRETVINKDEILRVSLFDAARNILEGRKGLHGADPDAERKHFFRRNDAFFVDYNFIGLLVQQNYLKVILGQFNDAKRKKGNDGAAEVLDRMSQAADSLSDYALAENGLRSGQNWSLLPFTGALTVKTGYHAGGETGGLLPGFPEFTAWLGKNSSKGKKMRILQELQHHLNYKVSGGTSEMRMSYLPVFRQHFLALLQDSNEEHVQAAIDLMDQYGLDRDDVFERFDEFKMDSKARSFGDLDSKQKAAFTRTYNQMAHRSQALVAEQGDGGKKKTKRGGGGAVSETVDPDAIDDDKNAGADEEDEADEEDVEKLRAMFKRKGRKKTATKKPATKKAKKKK